MITPPPTRRPVVASSVGGGPAERLIRRLSESLPGARLLEGYAPERWRALMSAGPAARVRARLGAMLGFPLRALREALGSRGSILIPTTNPFFLPFALVATRPLHGQPVVPLVYDLYPDALEATGMTRSTGLAARLGEAANRYVFRHADGVVFIGERMGAHARARYGEPRRWMVAETGAEAGEFDEAALGGSSPQTDLERWCDGRVVLGYVGNMGRVHDWETLARALPAVLSAASAPVGMVVAASGPGVERLRQAWAGLPPDAVRFVPPLDDLAWARLLRRLDVSIVTLRDEARNTSIPSKTFSAMAAGNAIVAIAPLDSDVATVVDRNDCGLVVAPGDADRLAAALLALIADPARLERLGANARLAVEQRYDMPRLAARWSAFLAEAGEGGRQTEVAGPRHPVQGAAKAVLDRVAAAAGLLALSPIIALGAAAVWASLGRPIFFRQERPGRHGRPFRIVKFRTMRAAFDAHGKPLPDEARLTAIGRLLRASSVDELPQLWNVLRGELSLVGPRPLLMQYLDRYTPAQARRHEVKPGITGWAQVNGRNALSWEKRFELDVWYVDHWSLWLDLRILALTALRVMARSGIAREGHATMPEFLGTVPDQQRRED